MCLLWINKQSRKSTNPHLLVTLIVNYLLILKLICIYLWYNQTVTVNVCLFKPSCSCLCSWCNTLWFGPGRVSRGSEPCRWARSPTVTCGRSSATLLPPNLRRLLFSTASPTWGACWSDWRRWRRRRRKAKVGLFNEPLFISQNVGEINTDW